MVFFLVAIKSDYNSLNCGHPIFVKRLILTLFSIFSLLSYNTENDPVYNQNYRVVKLMNIEFGQVQKYDERGFGFVSRTLNKPNQRSRKGVWFHISKIKYDYPKMAEHLDSGSLDNVRFWYEIEHTEREKVSVIWLDAKEIPETHKNDLVAYIEKIWCDIDNSAPEWLGEITIALVGENRKNELIQKRNDLINQREELEQKNQASQQARSHEEPQRVYIGLPENFVNRVLWVARQYRTHIWSHEPGGYDVVVEYDNEEVRGYDWIKRPSAYIRSFFYGEIVRVFARNYVKEEEYSTASYEEVWNIESSNEDPCEALEKFEQKQEQKNKSSILQVSGIFESQDEFETFDSGDVWESWYNEDEGQWYFGECPECNIPDRD
jgi:hypothetical protein